MFSGHLTRVPVLICLKAQSVHRFLFKMPEIIFCHGKNHHLCRLWMNIWICWYVCISHLCRCAMCQALIIISCIHCCLVSIFGPECTTITPNDESMHKILCFVHGQSMKLLLKRSIMGFTSYTACVVQETRNTYAAMGLKTRTKLPDLARTAHVSFNSKATLLSNIQYWLFYRAAGKFTARARDRWMH